MGKHFVALAVFIPFTLLCLLIVRAELHVSQGQEWQFEVQGYDPRDLLRGHYLRFRLSYNWAEDGETCHNENECCLCLQDIGEQAPLVSRTDCATAKRQCDGFMRSEFEHELNRFYIAEDYAKQAEKILRDARNGNNAFLSLAISKEGEPQIIDMLIDGTPLNELLIDEYVEQ